MGLFNKSTYKNISPQILPRNLYSDLKFNDCVMASKSASEDEEHEVILRYAKENLSVLEVVLNPPR